jgi:hypothetical protein
MNQQLGTSAQPPPFASISDNLQYSDFPVIQKFHFYRASLRHTLFFCRMAVFNFLIVSVVTAPVEPFCMYSISTVCPFYRFPP